MSPDIDFHLHAEMLSGRLLVIHLKSATSRGIKSRDASAEHLGNPLVHMLRELHCRVWGKGKCWPHGERKAGGGAGLVFFTNMSRQISWGHQESSDMIAQPLRVIDHCAIWACVYCTCPCLAAFTRGL